MWDFVLVPGAALVSSLEGAVHVTPASLHTPSGLETAPLPADLSSVGVIPLESGTIVPIEAVSGMFNPPASPQDDLDVPLSKLVSSRVEDKVTGVPERTARLPTPESPVVGVCSAPTHVGEAPPPRPGKTVEEGSSRSAQQTPSPRFTAYLPGFGRTFSSQTASPVIKHGKFLCAYW